jgi:hypothetical protein
MSEKCKCCFWRQFFDSLEGLVLCLYVRLSIGAIQMNFEPVRNSQNFEKLLEIFNLV